MKMLERRLDCLRMGVGVEEAAMVSMRSSRWLMLGVEGRGVAELSSWLEMSWHLM